MALVDQFNQPRAVDMRVDLRGCDVGMPEERLKCAQIGPSGQQVSGKGVAQHVWADPVRGDASVGGQRPNDLEQPDPAQMLAAAWKQPRRYDRIGLKPAANGVDCPR